MPYYIFAWIGSIGSALVIVATKLTTKHSISNPWFYNFLWMLFVLIFMAPIAIFNHASVPSSWTPIIIASIAQSIFYALYILSIYKLDVSTIAPLFNFRTIFAVLLGILLFQEKLTVFQSLIAGLVIIAGVFATFDEKMNVKSFFNLKVGLVLLSMLALSLANVCVKWAGETNSVWTITLWLSVFTFLSTIPTFPLFKKCYQRVKPVQVGLIGLISLLQVVTGISMTLAFMSNVGISSIIISLPFSMVFAILFSFFAPKLLEKHTIKVYLIRFVSTVIMIYGAFLLSR
jgi:drug/metabolite transporter (DMT)-like permease